MSGAARILAIVGGAVSAIFVIWAGFQWMTSAGDPQKIAQARMSLIGTVVGVIIIGVGFLVPGIISEFIIEPAGGISIQVDTGFDCDGALRNELVVRRAASTAVAVNQIVDVLQGQRDGCDSSFWDPVAFVSVISGGVQSCLDKDSLNVQVVPAAVAGMSIPGSLRHGANGPEAMRRDSSNNIFVIWTNPSGVGDDRLPSDGSTCWLYNSAFDTWREGYE